VRGNHTCSLWLWSQPHIERSATLTKLAVRSTGVGANARRKAMGISTSDSVALEWDASVGMRLFIVTCNHSSRSLISERPPAPVSVGHRSRFRYLTASQSDAMRSRSLADQGAAACPRGIELGLTGGSGGCVPICMEITRRRLLGLALAFGAFAAGPAGLASAAGLDPATPPDWARAGVERDETGTVVRVFELEANLALDVLQVVTKTDALPDGYVPGDLVSVAARGIASSGRQVTRAIIVDDTRPLIEAATAAGHALYVGSGFRSQAYQADVFAAQLARWATKRWPIAMRPSPGTHSISSAPPSISPTRFAASVTAQPRTGCATTRTVSASSCPTPPPPRRAPATLTSPGMAAGWVKP